MSKLSHYPPLLYSFDAGNGTCKGKSSETRAVVQFEPVIAPLTDRRGLQHQEERPTYSLKIDNQVLVFGVDDVFAHGKRTGLRRLNSQERYTNADYFHLLDVLYLHTFAAYRGQTVIAPTGILTVPIAVYNQAETIDQLRGTLVGKHELTDWEGCTLRLDIQPKRLLLLPESGPLATSVIASSVIPVASPIAARNMADSVSHGARVLR